MKRNIGPADKALRFFFAPILWVLYFTHTVTGVTGFLLLLLSVYFILSALLSFCPLYKLLGVTTFFRQK